MIVYIMSYASNTVKNWRRLTKVRMVESMGSKCAICAYDRCNDALAFHHLDPAQKEISFSQIRANPVSWPRIAAELRKCVMLCNNCHAEVHAGVVCVPEDAAKFDESYADPVRFKHATEIAKCPVCAQPMRFGNQTCSKECAGREKKRIDWDQYDLVEMKKTMSYTQIAKTVGAHLATVQKRFRKMGLR